MDSNYFKAVLCYHDMYAKSYWNDNKETVFIQPLNEPTGKRFLIETIFIEILDDE